MGLVLGQFYNEDGHEGINATVLLKKIIDSRTKSVFLQEV